MKTLDLTKPTRGTLKHLALAVAVAAGLTAGSAQALTKTSVIDLGTVGSGTALTPGAKLLKIDKDFLPAGSLLRSVAIDARIDAGDPYVGDICVFFDNDGVDPGVLRVGDNYDGGPTPSAAVQVIWDGGYGWAVGTTITKTITAGIPAIDLKNHAVSLTTGYSGTWSGTITLEYDIPVPARMLSFGPGAIIGEVVANAAAIAWTVPFGSDVTTLQPTFTLSSGTSDKTSGSTQNFTNPVAYTVTDVTTDPDTVNTYTVTVTVAPDESTLLWDVDSGSWDLSTVNWRGQTSGSPTPFFNGKNAVFDKTAGGAITIAAGVEPLTTTVSAASGTYTFNGGPIATGSLTKSGNGNLTITSDHSYTGGTIIHAGQLKMDVLANAALGTGPVTLNGGTLFLNRITAANTLIVNGGTLLPSNGWGNTWNGTVTLNSNLIISGDGNSGNMIFNGAISGAGGLTLNGPNALKPVLAVANSYMGPTNVTGCTLRCDNVDALGSGALSISSTANSKVNLNYTGTRNIAGLTLGGLPQPSGTHGSSASGATNPNDTYFTPGSTGTVTVPASSAKNMLTFSFGVLGAATIGDTTITLEVPFGTDRTSLSPTYTVSLAASGSPVSGTTRNFTGPQIYTVTAEDLTTKQYTVTVTEAVLPNIFTWANAASGDWSVAANWTNEELIVAAPLAGGRESYTLNFTTPGTYTATHNLSAGFKLNQLNLGAAVSLAGNGLAFVTNGLTLPTINQNSGSQVTISNDMELAANTTYGGSGNGFFDLSGLISGAGSLTKDGTGTLLMAKANSYAGGTNIENGTLKLEWPGDGVSHTTLGSGPVTLNGGTLQLNRTDLANALTVNGGSLFLDNGFGNAWTGPVTLNAPNLNITAYYTPNHLISGAISGSGGFTLSSAAGGGLALSGTNDYAGPTIVTAGTLRYDSAAAVASGALSITGGKVNLNYSGTKTIASLTLGGVPKTAPGTYGSAASGATFQDDTYFTTGSTGTVTIGGSSDYDTWLGEFNFAPGADKTPAGDPDGDGMSNQEEYAFGLNPTLGSSVNPIVVQLHPVTGNFQYTRRATPATTGLTYTVLTSTTLAGWVAGGATETGFTTAGNIQTVTVNVTTLPVDGKLFVRVQAAPTP